MTDILVFEGLDIGQAMPRPRVVPTSANSVIVPQRQFRQGSPYSAGASLPPSSPQWIKHNNVPLKPTKKRMHEFMASNLLKLRNAGGVTDEQARNQLQLIDEELFRLKHEVEDSIPVLKELSRKAESLTGTPGERARAEALGYASVMVRNVTRLIKLAVARQAVNVAIDNPKHRSQLFAFASTIREIPVKVKIPGTRMEDAILSSEKTAREMIRSKGRSVKRLAQAGVSNSNRHGVSHGVSMSGFGFSISSLKKSVEDWAKDTVSEAAGAVKNEVVSFARDTSSSLLDRGEKAIGDAIPKITSTGFATGSKLLGPVSGGAGVVSRPAAIAQQGSAEVTSPFAKAKSYIVPVAVILGGGYLVTRFI